MILLFMLQKFVALQYSGMMLIEEMASIFLTPYLLLFVVPKVIICYISYLNPNHDYSSSTEQLYQPCSE